MSEKSILDYETVDLDDGDNSVVIIDQTRLPGRTEIIRLHTAKEIWDAIYLLKVRGAQAERVFGFRPPYGGEFILGAEPYGAMLFKSRERRRKEPAAGIGYPT